MWQKKGFAPLAEGPSLRHGAVCPHPSSHTRPDCKRQVMRAPGSPQAWLHGEEN